MINSIKYFEEKSISRFEKLEDEFMKNPTKIAEYVTGLTTELHKLGLEMIKDSLEEMDAMLQRSPIRKRNWVVESHSTKQLITSLGALNFSKTLFTNKETQKSEYLLDRVLGLAPNERLTEDAEAKLLEEAVQTSYRRGGEEVSLMAEVSKQTVKNKIHQLNFPKQEEKPAKKKIVESLYLEADEDHISLQFRETKGDLKEDENCRKNNGIIAKLVYIHEGIEAESGSNKRHRLINPYYFCNVNKGEGNLKFGDQVYEYLDNHYDLKQVKKIYINSDGGSWIMAGVKRIAGAVHVLDEFHLEKYITKLTSHMKDSRGDAADEIRYAIRYKTKESFEELVDCLSGYVESETRLKQMEESRRYICSNWGAAKLRLRRQEGINGSSTEGHVSHVLSARMSSRPMGWSVLGASKMSQLRAYALNGGDMLELVRYQSEELPKAVGAEYEVLNSIEIFRGEKSRHGELGKYVDTLNHSLSDQGRKKLYFNSKIWGL